MFLKVIKRKDIETTLLIDGLRLDEYLIKLKSMQEDVCNDQFSFVYAWQVNRGKVLVAWLEMISVTDFKESSI